MSKERPHGGQRAEAEETRKAILHAAHTLFMELGYRSVTTRMVAEACGVKQPLLYYHFTDKETLYLEVQREQMTTLRAGLERIAARHSGSVPERLRAVVRYLRHAHPQDMGIFFHEMRHEMTPLMRSTLRDLFLTGIIAPILSIFEDGIQAGFLRSPAAGGVSPRLATFLLLSALSSFSHSAGGESVWSGQSPEEKESLIADEIVQVLIYGMVVVDRPPEP